MKLKTIRLIVTWAMLAYGMSATAQSPNLDDLEILRSAGYSVVKPLSFLVTKKDYALTVLLKNETDGNPVFYFAQMVLMKDGANMGFMIYRPCIITERNDIHERIIVINGQKIQTSYGCGIAPNESRTKEVYLVKSPAGNDYTKREFAGNHYVVVSLNGLPIPFATEGFAQILARSEGKAL